MEKKRLNFWQIWNMSFGFLGIQFGFALQNANTSRIFQTLGASVDNIPILWIAAPTTGLIIQPIIGYMSDRTWGRLGRRKPYFLTGAILASLALLLMPNSPYLWVAAGMLWIMDASINVSMEPFRALVADLLPSEQRTMGFAIQSFFIGIGAVVASALPYIFDHWFHVSNVAAEGEIPASVRFSFYAGAVAFISAVIWTVAKTKEYPPADIEAFQKQKNESAGLLAGAKDIFKSFVHIPKTMAQLAVVQFFTWFSLFAMWIYTTPAVTKHIYHTVDTASAAYNEGANWVGILFAAYNGFAALCAFLLPVIAKKTSRKVVHMISLVIGGLGLASFYVIGDPTILLVSMLGIGLAWASILSMPYAILAGSLPANKMGVYMGIFNFFIVIPQIIASAILGYFMKTFLQNEAIYALLLGGASMILAGILVLFVKDVDEK
ncbi:MAG: SLC45 family MFS transporter [Ignavibacteria bacterium]|jgi:maltose/moltooligosaccharide transporter|nr:SLC45 family MFS transporter [Ignavibacteria bacterium]MCU7501483.1 SLC45 family MFS transporter [Ignavibacteria bacterium]MCU7516001.1 SLC45 family MFS transporter [Ignavibacteria bacterium]